jgi:hypothetical protein
VDCGAVDVDHGGQPFPDGEPAIDRPGAEDFDSCEKILVACRKRLLLFG